MADVLGGGHADRPLVVYTFDDGYRDNFELAYPVFKRHEAPFAIYVASGLPDGGGLGWPFALEELVNTRATVDTNIGGLNRRSSLTTEPERTSAYDLIREAILASVSANGDKQVDSFFKTNAIGLKDYSRSISMSWEQIKELACEPLATLGSHTANHYMLSRLPPADALREVEDGKARLETETGKRVRHFAYPYGCKPVSDNLAATMGERLGFATCVTTRSGFLCPDHADHLASLPRFQVSEDTPLDSLHIGFKRLVDLVRGRKKDFVVG
jgi:peptidoglycan/xylan/chitin deacetylase (PgdA/CDA1 family)